MAMDQFIKIGSLKGEAKDSKHKEEIDVLSWSWGVANSGSAQAGGGQGAGKCSVQDLSFSKYIDKSSPDLLLCCCNGKHVDKATLTIRKAGEKPLEYLKITLEDLIITSVSTGGSGGEDRLIENVSLNFARVKVDYKEQTEKGTVGATPTMGWNVATNAKI
jgi:type VI secretion system secreted protein Hcp